LYPPVSNKVEVPPILGRLAERETDAGGGAGRPLPATLVRLAFAAFAPLRRVW
jgi:hypothetical protein